MVSSFKNIDDISEKIDIKIQKTINSINDKQMKKNTTQKSSSKSKISKNTFIPDYYVYTDGACINNGKPSAKAGYGIFFEINDPRNVSQKILGKQTNNIAELTAILQTYYIIENDIINGKKIIIVSDSIYAIRCVTSYGKKCNEKDWNVDIPNKELVKKTFELYNNKSNVQFMHIKAHTNNSDIHSIGNKNADKLATMLLNTEEHVNEIKNVNKTKIYLNVLFNDKEKIKILGGKWDKNKKKWFIYETNKNKDIILTNYL